MNSRKPVVSGRGLMAIRGIARTLYGLQGTGLPRVSEWLRRRVAQRAARQPGDGVWIKDFCDDQRFFCDLSEHMGSQIFFRGSYSGGQLDVLRALLEEDSVFVDAGANQGEFTVCAAGNVPRGQVFAFEPVPGVRQRLERNVHANGCRNVEIHSTGLSSEPRDDVPIFGADTVFADGTQNIGLPTLFGMAGRQAPLARISLRRLDDVLSQDQRVAVLKIDVEGAELAVLKGAEHTIRREQPAIIFEANEETCEAAGYRVDDLCAWLSERGYKLEQIGSRGELTEVKGNVRFSNILARYNSRALWRAEAGSE